MLLLKCRNYGPMMESPFISCGFLHVHDHKCFCSHSTNLNCQALSFLAHASCCISIPATLKITRDHQIFSPHPQRPAGVAWREAVKEDLRKTDDLHWVVLNGWCGGPSRERSDYHGSIWKRLSLRRSTIPQQAEGGWWEQECERGCWSREMLLSNGHDQRHGVGVCWLGGLPGSWRRVNAAYQHHTEASGGWDHPI